MNIGALFRSAFGRSMHDEVLNNVPLDSEVGFQASLVIGAAAQLIDRLPDPQMLKKPQFEEMVAAIERAVEHQIKVYYYG